MPSYYPSFLRKSLHLITKQPSSPLYPVSVVSAVSSYLLRMYPKNIKTGSITGCDLFGEMRSKRVRIVLVRCFQFFSGLLTNDQTTPCDTVACCVEQVSFLPEIVITVCRQLVSFIILSTIVSSSGIICLETSSVEAGMLALVAGR